MGAKTCRYTRCSASDAGWNGAWYLLRSKYIRTVAFERIGYRQLTKEIFTASLRSDLVNKHSEYAAKGDEPRHAASLQFFEKLGLLTLLNESEQHAVFYRAIERLWNVHNGTNNFYNEPPFAERLLELSLHGAVPETAQEQFVQVVVCCNIGNGYGVCCCSYKLRTINS